MAERKRLRPDDLFAKDPETGRQRCLVYSRVVGYLQPVRLWNAGKQQEFRDRQSFLMPTV